MKDDATSVYWNLRRTLTHNRLINVIVGNRGGGKTFGSKQWAIDRFLETGEQFGYIRRYKEDLKDSAENLFKDIEYQYPDYQFLVEGNKFYIRLRKEDAKWTSKEKEKCLAGYGFTLSTASNKKSISYPKITTLIFDEFLIEKGNVPYLQNEPIKLLNLYETIARPGTDHPRVILFMLANAISITNPYFLFWDLKMPNKQDKNGKWIWKHPTRPILVEDVRNEAFIDKKRNTEFGSLVSGTKYAEYSIENKFLMDDDTFLEKKSPTARYYFTFKYQDKLFGVWVDFNMGRMWVSKDIEPSWKLIYATTIKDHEPNTLYLKSLPQKSHWKMFIEYYKMGYVRFENMNIKNMCYEVIKNNI